MKTAQPSRLSTKRRPSIRSRSALFEVLEGRQLLTTFLVTNRLDTGEGSLRRAIIHANQSPGADAIDFAVAGTIRVGRSALPTITGAVLIDGSTAPGFAGSPVVTVDFRRTKGLRFAAGSDGSTLRSLSLVGAGGSGVTLGASKITVQGNFIGVHADGKSVGSNRGDGIHVDASSRGDLIGREDPVTGVAFAGAGGVGFQPVSAWQGIRGTSTSGQYLITGTSGNNGLLYEGPISGLGGTSYAVNVPGASSSSVYGPDVVGGDVLRLVGSFKNGSGLVNGFVFQGTTADLSNPGDYTTVDYPGAKYTYVHSTMGGLAVGNADGPEGNAPLGTGHAFIDDVATGVLTGLVYPGSTTTTAYGIWSNGKTSYTIAGGYTALGESGGGLSHGYLVDYDSATGLFTNWATYDAPGVAGGSALITHFEGVDGQQKGVYTLAVDTALAGSGTLAQGDLATVRRNADGRFGPALYTALDDPSIPGVVSANSVAGNQVVGVVFGSNAQGVSAYQATVNVGFQLSNVISGNFGNGIELDGASDDVIAMNDIGTDATGTLKRANAKDGIRITRGARDNLIGGQASGGNDPTAGVFVRPPQGNLISANGGDGVHIDDGATRNVLSGNFVGTTGSGDSALGNRGDGVAISHASGNSLIGCLVTQDPFVYYNVLSGNGGDGLRVTDSNDTTVQANFLGVGADNASVVANGGDGLLVSGTSANTQVGGVIPLGNVISGNDRNGIEVRDSASGFVSFNTFAGLYAFSTAAPNRLDGILVTSTGGNNQIRTSIVSGNLGNGIEIAEHATGVQVTQTAVGTNTSINAALPNGGDGIRIDGDAHGNAIGGFQPSIEPQTTVSSNDRYGIEIAGKARDNVVFNARIGTSFNGKIALGNVQGGIAIASGASRNTIGGVGSGMADTISDNLGNGVTIRSADDNAILLDDVEGNSGVGVALIGGRSNRIGSTGETNTIVGNAGDGVSVSGAVSGSLVQGNAIDGNLGNGVTLRRAVQVTIGGTTPGAGNRIASNQGYGVQSIGANLGSVVEGNVYQGNGLGNVN